MSLNFCSLASGSSGNCQYIATEKTGLLLDAGMSGKYIANAMESINANPHSLDGILVTHEHSDHISGIGVMMRRYGLKLYITELTFNALEKKLGKYDDSQIVIIDHGPLTIGDIDIQPVAISHDAIDPLMYNFMHKSSKVSIATDLGTIDEAVVKSIEGADLLMIESNHDIEMLKVGRYPHYLKKRILSDVGHLSNISAGVIAAEVIKRGHTKNILLAHLSKDNNFPDLAFETVKCRLEEEGIMVGTDVNLDMTYRDHVGRFYQLSK